MNNTINIDGRELMYTVHSDSGEYGVWCWTHFYETTFTLRTRKWFDLFGPIIEREVPNIMFTIRENIYSKRLTKEFWRREISKNLKKYDSLKHREDEIKNGEFI